LQQKQLFISEGERAKKRVEEAKTVLSSFQPESASVLVFCSLFFTRFSFLVSLTKLTPHGENVRGGEKE